MAIRSISQLKAWFQRGKYPSEEQFADLMDSYVHKEESTIPIIQVEELADRLNGKYDANAGTELECQHQQLREDFDEYVETSNRLFDSIAENIEELETVDERQQGEIDALKKDVDDIRKKDEEQDSEIADLHEADADQQQGINVIASNLEILRKCLHSTAKYETLENTFASLGDNYKNLWALANTVKTFLESKDTADATINTWQEIEVFLQGITDTQSLTALLAALETNITSAYNNAITAAVATEKERAENAEADLEERISQSQSAILLDTTLTEEETNTQMSNILQAFLENPAIQVVIKANVPVEDAEEGAVLPAWFNYVMINHQEQVIDETNTQHWLVLTAGATMNATSIYIGITATAMNDTVVSTNIQTSNTPFITNNWSDADIPEGIPTDNDKFLFNDGTKNKKITKRNLIDSVPYIGENLVSKSAYISGTWYWFAQRMPFVTKIIGGETYTLSADIISIQGNGFMWVLADTYGGDTYQTVMETRSSDLIGTRQSVTFVASKDYEIGAILGCMGTNEDGGTAKNVKLEKGAKATPYIPTGTDIPPIIDYTSLEEQIVPGEFCLGFDGTKKQVYIRTFYLTGTLSENSGTAYHYLTNVPSSLIPINYSGCVSMGGFVTSIPYSFYDALRGTSTDVATIFNNGANVVFYLSNIGRKGIEYTAVLTIKYFKNE